MCAPFGPRRTIAHAVRTFVRSEATQKRFVRGRLSIRSNFAAVTPVDNGRVSYRCVIARGATVFAHSLSALRGLETYYKRVLMLTS